MEVREKAGSVWLNAKHVIFKYKRSWGGRRRMIAETKRIYFIQYVKKFQTLMGMLHYDISIDGMYMDERGSVKVDEMGKIATIYYSIDWLGSSSTTKEDISRTAFHEMMELMLNRMRIKLERYYSIRVVRGLMHEVIVRMENTLWKEWGKTGEV